MYAITPTFLSSASSASRPEWGGEASGVWPVWPAWAEWPPVTLVEGAWGSGKTAWLGQELGANTAVGTNIAWVHLTDLHDLPQVFWPAVLQALQTIDPQLGTAAQRLLKSILLVPHLAFVNLLKNEIAHYNQPLVLVLANCEKIRHNGLREALAFLADELPDNVRLILVANESPHLNLDPVELRGDLARMTPAVVSDLALPEVRQLAPAVQTLLAQTCYWPWLSAELVAAAQGEPDPVVWADLLATGLLQPVLVDHKEGYFIYPDPVVAHITAVLSPNLTTTQPFNRRAVAWLAQQGALSEACHIALAYQLDDLAADLLEKPAMLPSLLARAAYDLALQWGTAVSETLIDQRPLLAVYLAWAYLHQGNFAQADSYVERAEAATPFIVQQVVKKLMAGYLATVRSIRGYMTQQYSATLAYAHLALENLPDTMPNVRAYVSICLADAYRLQGNYPAARDAFEQANQLFNLEIDLYLVTYGYILQGKLWQEWGQLARAATFYEKVITHLRHNQMVLESPLLGEAYLGLGQLLYEQNELTAAYKAITYALMLLEERTIHLSARLEGYLTLGRIYAALDEMGWARFIVNHLLALAHQPVKPAVATMLAAQDIVLRATAMLAQLDLQVGQVAEAEAWATAHGLGVDDALTAVNEEVYLVYARLLIAQGEPFVALRLLKRLLDNAQAAGRTAVQISVLTGQALALATQGHPIQAMTKLEMALALGEAEQFVRRFVEDGEPIALLLAELATAKEVEKAEQEETYLQTLLNIASGVTSPVWSLNGVALPPREADILAYLTDPEASPVLAMRAQQLQMAEATLAWHEHRLCHRLGVPLPTAVGRRAQLLGGVTAVPEGG